MTDHVVTGRTTRIRLEVTILLDTGETVTHYVEGEPKSPPLITIEPHYSNPARALTGGGVIVIAPEVLETVMVSLRANLREPRLEMT